MSSGCFDSPCRCKTVIFSVRRAAATSPASGRYARTPAKTVHNSSHRTARAAAGRPGKSSNSALDARLVVEDQVQQRGVDLDAAIVLDQAELAELVHEEADARARRADHLGQCFLAD